MRWSHLHGDMQGRRGAQEDTSSAQKEVEVFLSKILSEIPCRVSSDPHEWRNELGAVSATYSAKLKYL